MFKLTGSVSSKGIGGLPVSVTAARYDLFQYYMSTQGGSQRAWQCWCPISEPLEL